MTISPLKSLIFKEVKNKYEKHKGLSDEDLDQLMFRTEHRLTFSGFVLLKHIFTAYSFEIPITLKARHYIGMSVLSSPYFLTSKKLVLFSSEDALIVKLSGSVELFLHQCYGREHVT